MAYVFSYQTEIFQAEPYLSYVQEIAFTKTRAHPWWVIFLKAIPANTLVCMAVMLGFAARDGAGKVGPRIIYTHSLNLDCSRYWRFGSR